MEDKNQSAISRYQARRPFPTRARDWPTAPRARPLELKLDLTANSAHQLFLEASSSWPNTANHSGWNAPLTMRQPFSLTYGIPLSAGPVSQLQTLKKMKHAGEKEREQIVLPVLFFFLESVFNGFSPRTKSFKTETSLAGTRGPTPRTSLIWPFRI